MKARLYTISYAVCLGAVCAGLLTGAGKTTRSYIEANERAEEVRNILGVLQVPRKEAAGAKELLGVFERAVRQGVHREQVFYVHVKDGAAATAAFAFKGQGVWGPIEGFLALEPDLLTVRGVTFHKQEETPGLGGEIEREWFRAQFRGKSIRDENGSPGIPIRKGGASGPHEVDAISGATMTCVRVEDMLTVTMKRILEERGALISAIKKLTGEGGDDAG